MTLPRRLNNLPDLANQLVNLSSLLQNSRISRMKKLILLALILPASLFSQEDSGATQKKFVRFVSINAYSGGDLYRDGYEDRTLFQQAAPSSVLAFTNLAGYTNSGGIIYSSISFTSGINANLHLRCQKKTGELRFGVSHSFVNVSSQSYYQQSTTTLAIDTLSNGDIVATDSIASSWYRYNWNSDVLNLHLGWIVRSDPKRWVSVYTGFDCFAGVGYNGTIRATHAHESREVISFLYSIPGAGYYGNNKTEISVEEFFRAPSFTSIGGSIPIGFNVRLGRRDNFLKHVAVFGEYNGGVHILIPKGTDSKIRTASSMYGGIRWYIKAPEAGRPGRGHRRGYTHGEEHLQH
jgi:hypothetical protein